MQGELPRSLIAKLHMRRKSKKDVIFWESKVIWKVRFSYLRLRLTGKNNNVKRGSSLKAWG